MVLGPLPGLLLAVLAPVELYRLLTKPVRPGLASLRLLARSTLALASLALASLQLGLVLTSPTVLVWADLLAPASDAAGLALALVLAWLNHRAGRLSSGIAWSYWTSRALCQVTRTSDSMGCRYPSLRQVVTAWCLFVPGPASPALSPALQLLQLSLGLALSWLHCWADPAGAKPAGNPSPQLTAR